MQNLNKKLRTLREANGYKQEYVGNYLGLTQTGYSKIEVGEVDLSVKHLQKLAKLYNISPEQLLIWDGKISISTLKNSQNIVSSNLDTNPIEERLRTVEQTLENVLRALSQIP